MERIHRQILICAVVVVMLALGARRVAESAWVSVVNYRSPYLFHALLPAGPRLVDRVVLVTLDGLRRDVSRQLPFLNQLRARGADLEMRVGEPSLSNPGRAATVTGAWADVHGVTTNFTNGPIETDNVPLLARKAHLKTASAGSKFWRRNLGFAFDAQLPAPEEPPSNATATEIAAWQKAECGRIRNFIQHTEFDFLAIDLVAGDIASHHFGPLSEKTATVYREVDACLAQLVATLDISRSTIIAAADHGHVQRAGHGGHGGGELDVLTVPLVLAGAGIHAAAPPAIRPVQVDIAPTICALLGLPMPATNEGTILASVLNIRPEEAAQLAVVELQQKVAFRAYRDGLPDEAARQARRSRTPLSLALAVLLAGAIAGLFVGVLKSRERSACVLALCAFCLVYFALFRLFDLGYSLSAVNEEANLQNFFTRDMAIGLTAALAAALLLGLLLRPASALEATRLGTALIVLLSLVTAILPLFAYWYGGLWMKQWLPPFGLSFAAYLNLLVLFALLPAVLLAPVAVWAAARPRRRVMSGGGQRRAAEAAENSVIKSVNH